MGGGGKEEDRKYIRGVEYRRKGSGPRSSDRSLRVSLVPEVPVAVEMLKARGAGDWGLLLKVSARHPSC